MLRELLLEAWPGCYIPPIPPKVLVVNLYIGNIFLELEKETKIFIIISNLFCKELCRVGFCQLTDASLKQFSEKTCSHKTYL